MLLEVPLDEVPLDPEPVVTPDEEPPEELPLPVPDDDEDWEALGPTGWTVVIASSDAVEAHGGSSAMMYAVSVWPKVS